MTAISSNNQITNSQLINQNSIATSTPSNSSKNSNSSKLYLGPGWTNVPGITNLFYAPYDFVKSVKAMLVADRISDEEGITVNGLRVASNYFSAANSLSQLIWYVTKGGVYFKLISNALNHSFAPLSSIIPTLGFIMFVIEGILEIYGFVKTKEFYSEHYPSELESFRKALNLSDPLLRQQKFSELLNTFLQSSATPIEVKNEIEIFLRKKDCSNEEFNSLSENLLDQIEKNVFLIRLKKLQRTYLQISPEGVNEIEANIKNKFSDLSLAEQQEMKEKIINENLDRKKNDLIRRVNPWLVNEIQETTPEILQNLQSSDPLKNKEAKEKAAEIFKNIKTQSLKQFLIHSVGLAAVLITFAGLVLSCVACPFFLPFIVLSVGGILALTRYYLDAGLMNSRGWEFKITNCIPSFIQSIYKKISSPPKQKIPEPFYSLTLDFDFICKRNSLFQESHSNHLDFTISVPPEIKV